MLAFPGGLRRQREDSMAIVGRGRRVPGMGRSLSELNVQSGQGSAELGSMATGEITNQGLPQAAACAFPAPPLPLLVSGSRESA